MPDFSRMIVVLGVERGFAGLKLELLSLCLPNSIPGVCTSSRLGNDRVNVFSVNVVSVNVVSASVSCTSAALLLSQLSLFPLAHVLNCLAESVALHIPIKRQARL